MNRRWNLTLQSQNYQHFSRADRHPNLTPINSQFTALYSRNASERLELCHRALSFDVGRRALGGGEPKQA